MTDGADPREIYRTGRLVIRPWGDADAERHYDIYRRMEVAKWLGGQPPKVVESAEQSVGVIARWNDRWPDDDRFGIWAVEVQETGVVAGTVLLVPMARTGEDAKVPEDGGDVEVGWHFHPDSWGHGFATEAAQGALDKAWTDGLQEVLAVVLPGNEPSVAVTRRLGMEPVGRSSRWYGLEMDAFRLARPT